MRGKKKKNPAIAGKLASLEEEEYNIDGFHLTTHGKISASLRAITTQFLNTYLCVTRNHCMQHAGISTSFVYHWSVKIAQYSSKPAYRYIHTAVIYCSLGRSSNSTVLLSPTILSTSFFNLS